MCALQQIGAMPMAFIHFLSGNFTIYTAHSPPSSVLASDELAARNPVFYLILSVEAHIQLTIGFCEVQDV